MDGIAYLIRELFDTNDYGQRIATHEKREVFVTEGSITRNEFFSAGRQGLNPEIMLITPKINYEGEELVEYNNVIYSIYRAYVNGDMIEIYGSRKAGSDE